MGRRGFIGVMGFKETPSVPLLRGKTCWSELGSSPFKGD